MPKLRAIAKNTDSEYRIFSSLTGELLDVFPKTLKGKMAAYLKLEHHNNSSQADRETIKIYQRMQELDRAELLPADFLPHDKPYSNLEILGV